MFPVLSQQGDCDSMHCAVLADFSRCLHVRKRKYSPPSDLGNQPNRRRHAIGMRKRATQLLEKRLVGSAQRREAGRPFTSLPPIVRQSGGLANILFCEAKHSDSPRKTRSRRKEEAPQSNKLWETTAEARLLRCSIFELQPFRTWRYCGR